MSLQRDELRPSGLGPKPKPALAHSWFSQLQALAYAVAVLFLARMLVSHAATAPARLANTLAAHLRALAAVAAAD